VSGFLGKISTAWLLAIVEAMVKGENFKEFVRSSRVGSKVFQAFSRRGDLSRMFR
jgi:hypothetical protein